MLLVFRYISLVFSKCHCLQGHSLWLGLGERVVMRLDQVLKLNENTYSAVPGAVEVTIPMILL